MAEFRNEAERKAARPVSRGGLLFVVMIWLAVAAGAIWLGWRALDRP